MAQGIIEFWIAGQGQGSDQVRLRRAVHLHRGRSSSGLKPALLRAGA